MFLSSTFCAFLALIDPTSRRPKPNHLYILFCEYIKLSTSLRYRILFSHSPACIRKHRTPATNIQSPLIASAISSSFISNNIYHAFPLRPTNYRQFICKRYLYVIYVTIHLLQFSSGTILL